MGFVVKDFPKGNGLGLLPMLVTYQLPACLSGFAFLPSADGYMSSQVSPVLPLQMDTFYFQLLCLWQFATFTFILNCPVNVEALNDCLCVSP